MGKAIRWLRALLGLKKDKDVENSNPSTGDRREKTRRSFSKPGKDLAGIFQSVAGASPKKPFTGAGWQESYLCKSREEQNKHAIACAAASAAAADAAVVAAQAAVAAVRLQRRGRKGAVNGGREVVAAAKIQNVFRGYLARKALRALKGLVKLQALVRGYLVRKRAAATFHSMQALIRAQSTVRSHRARRSYSQPSPSDLRRAPSTDSDDPKIVEIDTFRPRSRSRRCNSPLSEFGDDRTYFPVTASPARFSPDRRKMQELEWYLSATPAKSVAGEMCLRRLSNCPNYMMSTESFKAKVRSHSAPKQRPEGWTRKRVGGMNEIMAPRNSVSSSVGINRSYYGFGEEEEE